MFSLAPALAPIATVTSHEDIEVCAACAGGGRVTWPSASFDPRDVPGGVEVHAPVAAIKSDLGHLRGHRGARGGHRARCPGTATQALSAAAAPGGTDPTVVRAAFSAAARELGWAPVKVGGGQVL